MTPVPAPDDEGAPVSVQPTADGVAARVSFRRRLVVSLLAAALLPLLVFGLLALVQVDAAVGASLRSQVETALTGANGWLARDQRDLEKTTLSYATWPVLEDAVAAGDLAGLEVDVVDFQVGLGEFDAVAVAAGREVTSGGAADVVAELEAIALDAALAPATAADVGPGTIGLPSGVYQVAAVPVIAGAGTVGSVAMAMRIDGPTAVAISYATGFDVAVTSAAGGTPVVTDISLIGRLDPASSATPEPGITVGDGLAVGRSALRDSAGVAVGMLTVVKPLDALDSVATNLVALVAGTLTLASLGAVLLAWALGVRLRLRAEEVAGWLDAVGAGGAPRASLAADADLRTVSRAVDDLATALRRRERRLEESLDEIARLSPRLGAHAVAEAGTRAAARLFDAAEVVLETPAGTPIATATGVRTVDPAPAAVGTAEAALEAVATAEVAPEVAPDAGSVPRPAADAWTAPPARLVARGASIAEWTEPDRAIFDLYARLLGIAIRDADLVDRAGDRARELDRLATLQADFMRGVSHNLQQPLTTIRLVAEDVADADPTRAREAAAHIRAESDRLSRLVGQLLVMSRLEAGTMRVEAEPLAPASLIRHVWAGFRSVRRFTVDDRAPGVLAVADRASVEQILWILLDNALKYAPRGPVTVRIEARPAAALGGGPPVTLDDAWLAGAVAISVIDAGPGVPIAERARIFERFVRGTASEGTDGTGLGLDVARGLAGAMGGHLVYRDDAAPGSTFELLLPAEPDLGPA